MADAPAFPTFQPDESVTCDQGDATVVSQNSKSGIVRIRIGSEEFLYLPTALTRKTARPKAVTGTDVVEPEKAPKK